LLGQAVGSGYGRSTGMGPASPGHLALGCAAGSLDCLVARSGELAEGLVRAPERGMARGPTWRAHGCAGLVGNRSDADADFGSGRDSELLGPPGERGHVGGVDPLLRLATRSSGLDAARD